MVLIDFKYLVSIHQFNPLNDPITTINRDLLIANVTWRDRGELVEYEIRRVFGIFLLDPYLLILNLRRLFS
jgi:hypothetical protein